MFVRKTSLLVIQGVSFIKNSVLEGDGGGIYVIGS